MSGSFARTLARVLHRPMPRSAFGASKPRPSEGGPLRPKLWSVLRGGYSLDAFGHDVLAGLTVGIVAMPLAMAFAIASGLTPIQGLYTAVVAGIVIGLLGGSRFQVSGPTGAFVVIIYGIVYRHGYDGLVITTLLAGGILVVAGMCRLGSLIKFIPYPVTTGFTAGIALIIFSQQMGDFFGLPVTQAPPEFFRKWAVYLANMDGLSPVTLAVAASTLAVMLAVRRFLPRVPAPVAGVVFGALLVWGLGLPVDTIAGRFGSIPEALPTFHWPEITIERIQVLFPDAVTIALLAGLESLLTCVVADSMTGDRHFSNMELVAQGSGNIACALMGGIPATGAIARTATNIGSGARSPVSSIVHGLTVLAFVLWLSPLTSAIPLASLAAVMVIISWNMLETKAIKAILRGPKSDWSVMLLTFGLTVVVDLTVAVYVGVILASLLFMRRMSAMSDVHEVECDSSSEECLELPDPVLPDGVCVFSINGPFFFGMVDRFQSAVAGPHRQARVYVLNMHDVPSIDATGIHVLEAFLAHRSEGYRVVLAAVPAPTRRILRRMGLLRSLGEDNVCHSLETALARADILANPRPVDDGSSRRTETSEDGGHSGMSGASV